MTIEKVCITPAPMSIQQAVAFYQRLTEEGKAGFVEFFHVDDQEVLRKALEDASEIIYSEGGLHTIEGKCVGISIDADADPDDPTGDYTIETEKRTYGIYLNLPLSVEHSPENKYPAVGERVSVMAENIHEDKEGIFLGYAEICQVVDRTA